MQAILQGHMRLGEALRAAGKVVAAERLRPDSDGARVRVKAGHAQVMDGPFAETKEAIGGVYLIDCDTKAGAGEWAQKGPPRGGGLLQGRPLLPGEGRPRPPPPRGGGRGRAQTP